MRIAKGHLRFSRKEIWNLKEYLSACIYDGLLQFKTAKRLCYPSDITPEIWEEYLDKMLFSFKEISTNCKNDPLEKYFCGNADFSEDTEIQEESKKYYDKIEEGLNLFSKYCLDLWD